MSKSLRLLNKNEQMSELLIILSELLIRSFLGKNKQFARKTDERIPSPALLQTVNFYPVNTGHHQELMWLVINIFSTTFS